MTKLNTLLLRQMYPLSLPRKMSILQEHWIGMCRLYNPMYWIWGYGK
jgi:hypothetical protein